MFVSHRQKTNFPNLLVYASKAEFPYVFLAETRMQNENMIEHAIKTIVDAIKNNPGEQVQHENKSFPVRKEFGKIPRIQLYIRPPLLV